MLYVPASVTPPGKFPFKVESRLIRPRDQRVGDPAPLATMYVSNRGGAIRRLIGSAHRHVIAMRRDPQNGFGQPTEGIAEGPAMMRVATDPDVAYYQTQPFRIELPVNGKLVSWIADLIFVDRDGSVAVREIKRTASDLIDLDYTAKLETVRWLLGGLGWDVQPWTLKEIKGSPERQANVGRIYFDRAAHINDLMPRFEQIAAATPTMLFGELVDELDPANRNRARSAVHRLIMLGRVWVNLDEYLEGWSPVQLRQPTRATWDLPFA